MCCTGIVPEVVKYQENYYLSALVVSKMIKSMTGYGKAIAETAQKRITIEIKSLNSKQFDLTTKLPWLYKEKEPELRNMISQKIGRGKIDFVIYFDVIEAEGLQVIDKATVKNYYKQIKEIADELNIELDQQILPAIMRLPDALKAEKPELLEAEWNLLRQQVVESINMLDLYRIEEGRAIEADLKKRISGIHSCLKTIETFEEGRITKIREKLLSILQESNGSENIDMNRFEQELIFFLEKYDINEEKQRLSKHCDYFLEMMSSEPPNGKVLGFIAQEIGREINTIGSKANERRTGKNQGTDQQYLLV
jgi:uncharacterized protein (TIGR00255 family)